jgi:DNA invertase Pin-like site-specific DNA recombinase
MGRLTLTVQLSFAQIERERSSERVRDRRKEAGDRRVDLVEFITIAGVLGAAPSG